MAPSKCGFGIIVASITMNMLAQAANAAIDQGISVTAAEVSTTQTAPSSKGYELGLTYLSDAGGSFLGGRERRLNLTGNLLINASLDLRRLADWRGASVFIQGIGIHGDSLSESVGDNQVSSNIEAPQAARIYQAWLQQELFEGKFSLLVGIHDFNSEFFATESSLMFLNSSFGVGPELSQTGGNGPSIFPQPGFATRARVMVGESWAIATAVYEGIPGGALLAPDEGILGVTEVSFSPEIRGLAGRYSLAAWGYSDQDKNRGIYFLANQKLYSPDLEASTGLSSFLRIGIATEGLIASHWGAGMVYTGAIPGRDSDQVGLAIVQAHSTSKAEFEGRETVIELSYQAKLLSWVMMQPDLQWIVNPGMDEFADTVAVAMARVQLTF